MVQQPRWKRWVMDGVQFTVLLLLVAYLVSFGDHARQMLGFAYPLDYGEGPLLAQVDRLRAGTPIWALYSDPSAPPFMIVNYPPVYLLLTAWLSIPFGSPLIAGRIIGLISALAATVALGVLAQPTNAAQRSWRQQWRIVLPALLFLTIPIVREWAALMRVDMLGVALGLWGLVAFRRSGVRANLLGGLLLAASLCTKPSLLAAPLAAGGWLLWQIGTTSAATRRLALRDLIVWGSAMGGAGLLCIGLLQWASGGWFWLHVVAANANRWEADLAWGFWRDQFRLRWALVGLALLAVGLIWRTEQKHTTAGRDWLILPLLYTLGGVITALGVGKVGAYSNYFLELYAGLIWLICVGAHAINVTWRRAPWAQLPIWILLIASMAYYPPLWDRERLRPAGLIEPSPPRFALGSGGLWADARREAELLGALSRVYAALIPEVQAAGPLIFSDLPGVPAAAAVGSRLQAFEARQLLDQALVDEAALRRELANGSLPLAVIDFLGNWLTPEVIELLQRRYAHDGAFGTFDLYRPVVLGDVTQINQTAGAGLLVQGYQLAAPVGNRYEPGELLTVGLIWQRTATAQPPEQAQVEVAIRAHTGQIVQRTTRLLLYGAIPPATWPLDTALTHLQPMHLPSELADGTYLLTVALQTLEGAALEPVVTLGEIQIAPQGGRWFAETQHFVPGRVLAYWEALGGEERVGPPLTPLVPFAWGRLQCFAYTCLELRTDQVSQRALGTQLYLAETQRALPCAAGLCTAFAQPPHAAVGDAVSGAVVRNGWLVQWTTFARLEQDRAGGPINLGRLGDDSLRLPPGMDYRWP